MVKYYEIKLKDVNCVCLMLMLPPNAHCGKVQTFNISEIDSCFVDHKNTRKQLGYKLILNALQIPIPAKTFFSIICTTTQLYFA